MKKQTLLVSRRKILGAIGAVAAAAPVAHLLGCSSDPGAASARAPGTPADDGGPGAAADAAPGVRRDAATAADGGGWASGGTAAIAASYPDPFAGGLGTTCSLTCSATLGPCYVATTTRKDISEGHGGLPVRMAFLVVDEACKPVPGATVDIWHTSPEGTYSGNDAPASCTLDDAAAKAARFFRGIQITDAKGRVDFDTCFPGWYGGRTVHIHFTVRINGVAFVTSQLYFDDALSDDILTTQPLYADRGPRDTTNQNDGLIAASEVAAYSFQTQRMPDGVLLAWKALVVRSSTAAPLCATRRS